MSRDRQKTVRKTSLYRFCHQGDDELPLFAETTRRESRKFSPFEAFGSDNPRGSSMTCVGGFLMETMLKGERPFLLAQGLLLTTRHHLGGAGGRGGGGGEDTPPLDPPARHPRPLKDWAKFSSLRPIKKILRRQLVQTKNFPSRLQQLSTTGDGGGGGPTHPSPPKRGL